jgi:hypothetical protein
MTWQQTSHNPEVAGSNPAPATGKAPETGLFYFLGRDRAAELLPNFCLRWRRLHRSSESTLAQAAVSVARERLTRCGLDGDPLAVETKTVEVAISPGQFVRVEGLQRDRRRLNNLRITLPDGRVALGIGRRPEEDGWEVYWEDDSGTVLGSDFIDCFACLLGYEIWEDQHPEWLDRLGEAVAERD